jgi:cold shock protein
LTAAASDATASASSLPWRGELREDPSACALQSPGFAPISGLSIFGRTTGPLRRFGAHVSASLSKIDEPGTMDTKPRAPSLACTPSPEDIFMHTGTVKFYNDQKGFGFIQPDNGEKDVFVHATALERAGINGLREGQKVAFDTQNDPRSGKIAVSKIEIA